MIERKMTLGAILLVLSIAVLIGADQLIKYWAVHTLQPKGTMEFIHFGNFKVFDLTYLENDGAIFGSMSGQRWFLIGFTLIVIIAGMVGLFLLRKRSRLLTAAIALFIAGGIGNFIDRVRYGYVVDMFETLFMSFPVFNVADICVTLSVIALLILILFHYKDKDFNFVRRTDGNEEHKD